MLAPATPSATLTEETVDDRVDFFISYNKNDYAWATWIAWTLEAAGYRTVIEAWDFRPGANFALEMQSALMRSDRLIAVLSPDYLAGMYASSEWASVFAVDPQGTGRRLVPVKVRECEPDGLLRSIIYIDLLDQPGEAARARLLGGVSAGRVKPLTVPQFPGVAGTNQVHEQRAPEPAPGGVTWTALTDPVPVTWRANTPARRAQGALVEVHLVPVQDTELVDGAAMRRTGDTLSGMGRAYGLFTQTQAVDLVRDLSVVTAFDGTGGGGGLLVTSAGQRGGWVPLPQDEFGAVLDERDVATRVVGLLRVLTEVDAPEPDRVAVAIGVAPATLVVVGGAADVGHRTAAGGATARRDDVRWVPRSATGIRDIRLHAEEVADRLASGITTAFDAE